VMLLSFILMVPAGFCTETRRIHKVALETAVAGLAVVLALMPLASLNFYTLVIRFVGFFIAFNLLEVLQPSLVSRVAPVEYKGLALGFYNTAQSLGVFAGAALGGVITSHGGSRMVFLLAAALAFVWFLTARGFRMGAGTPGASV